MSSYQAISRERHHQQGWQRDFTYAFAAREAVVPLTVTELPKAVMSLPTAFIQQANIIIPVAVLGLQTGNNLFVSRDGRWAGTYIPALLRAYPFRLVKARDGKGVLCIDEDSGLMTCLPTGEPFFAEDGQPAKAVLDVLNFLDQLEQSQLRTVGACAALQKHHLIRPWPIMLKTATGEQAITGLFQIDEAAVNALSGADLLEVRQAGALPVIYCQLLSMQHLPRLGQLAEAQVKAAAQALEAERLSENGELNLDFLNNNGTISFAGLL